MKVSHLKVCQTRQIWIQIVDHALPCSWQCQPPDQQDDQCYIGEYSRNIHHLKFQRTFIIQLAIYSRNISSMLMSVSISCVFPVVYGHLLHVKEEASLCGCPFTVSLYCFNISKDLDSRVRWWLCLCDCQCESLSLSVQTKHPSIILNNSFHYHCMKSIE